MLMKQIIDAYEVLDSSFVTGEAVKEYLLGIKADANVEVYELVGPKGSTDMLKVRIPGKNGKTNGGDAPTIGLLGRLGGIGARPERIGFVSDGDGALCAATTHPLATQEIDGMIDMIQTLIDKEYAYPVADGTVYFRVKKFKEYGKLSHKNLDDLQSGFRSLQVSGEDQKEDPLDFVLWKPKKEEEPYWTSPWCDGRPGWHIECSVMSKKYLGEEIDIHAGGEDLVFPHHENEIAQSECCNGVPFAKYWMHNAFLNIDNRKMSKSLGNFRTVREIGEQYDLQVLRFFMLNAHYRSPLNFSADLMESSKNALERITEAAARLRDRQAAATVQEATEDEKKLMQEEAAFVTKFEESMDDDFNTADALAAVFELVKFANTNVQEGSSKEFAGHTLEVMTKLCDVLGLTLEKKEEILDEEIENLIAERQAARKAKDFARADEIRGLLLDKGIELKDTREGVKWKRI